MPSFSPTSPILTTALHRAIGDFEAALISQPEIFRTLCEILDTTLVAGHPLAIGTVLAFVKSPHAIACFRWWEHSPEAESLAVLGEAISALPPHYSPPPLANSKAGREHFFGDLKKYYLLALLAERVPSTETDPHGWMFVLRAWLFLHAYMRHREGIRLDENLHTAARATRLACDTDTVWLQFFLRLYPKSPPKSFRELNFRLGACRRAFKSTQRYALNFTQGL